MDDIEQQEILYDVRRLTKILEIKNREAKVRRLQLESAEMYQSQARDQLRIAGNEILIAETRIREDLILFAKTGMSISELTHGNFSICGTCKYKTCNLCELPDEYREAH